MCAGQVHDLDSGGQQRQQIRCQHGLVVVVGDDDGGG
jgi:hypothetical protein